MPLDPSIYSQYLRPPKSVADFGQEAYGLERARLGNASAQLELLAGQRQMADQDAQRSAMARLQELVRGFRPGMSATDRATAYERGGYWQQADALRKADLDQRKEQATIDKDAAETQTKQYDLQRKKYEHGITSLMVSRTPEEAIERLYDGVGKGYFSMKDATAQINGMPRDADGFEQWRQSRLAGVVDAYRQLPAIQTRNTGATTDTLAIDPITGNVRTTGSVRNTQSPDSAASVAATRRGQNMTDARARELNATTKAEKTETRRADQVEKGVTQYSNTLQKEGIPELESAVAGAEAALSRYPKGQVPGIGAVKNILPASLMSDEGKDVRQSLAQVRNIVLSARSGAAVTDQELRRLVEEIGTGAGMSENDIRRGLEKVRGRLEIIKQNAAAGVSDDVKAAYEARGGIPIQRGGGGKQPARSGAPTSLTRVPLTGARPPTGQPPAGIKFLGFE